MARYSPLPHNHADQLPKISLQNKFMLSLTIKTIWRKRRGMFSGLNSGREISKTFFDSVDKIAA
jgi:hypothetical protein